MKTPKKPAACKNCKGTGVYVNSGKPVFCHPCCDEILRKSKVDCTEYYIDIVVNHHAVSKKHKKGKEIAGLIQYCLREKIGDMEQMLEDKYKTRVDFFLKP